MKTILSLLLPTLLFASGALAQPALSDANPPRPRWFKKTPPTGDSLAQTVSDANPPKFVPKNPPEFRFGGGNLNQFLIAIRDAFGVDIQVIGTVPQSMLYSVQVPKMRTGGEGQRLDFRNVLFLYNQISQDGDPSLGHWIIKGTIPREPEAIVLTPRQAEDSFAVKAFAIPDPKTRHDDFFEKLFAIIDVQRSELMAKPHPGLSTSDLEGRLQYHGQAGIIVATGGKVYVELVATVFEALKERAEQEKLFSR